VIFYPDNLLPTANPSSAGRLLAADFPFSVREINTYRLNRLSEILSP